MKQLRTLIKLKKREVDLLRKQMGQLQEQRAILEQLVAQLQEDLAREVALASGLVHMGVFFGDYSESIKQKQRMVEEKIEIIDKQIDLLAEKMRLAFGEQKTYEIVQQRKLAALAYRRERKEQQFLDEHASRIHAQS